MNRLRGIKSLWCDKERGRVLESVSVCCLSGGSFNTSFSLAESFCIPSPSVLFYLWNHFISSSPFLYYFGSSRSLSLPFCFSSFPSGAFPFRPLAALAPAPFNSPLQRQNSPRLPRLLLALPSCSGRLVSAEQQRGGLSAALSLASAPAAGPTRLPLCPSAAPLGPRSPLSACARAP